MSNIKFFSLAGQGNPSDMPLGHGDGRVNILWMNDKIVENCMFSQASWFIMPFKSPGMWKHDSDELHFFIGGNPEEPENLNAEIELWIENDRLSLTKTCAVFVPGGAAHGRIAVSDPAQPVFHYSCHLNKDRYEAFPAQATADRGFYAKSWVEKYAPVNGKLPEAPKGFLKLLLFLDGKRMPGAPYAEAVWFCTTNDTGPAPHSHTDFDEFIGFFGSDPDHPAELNGQIDFFIEDEMISVTKSCLVYIPRGLRHSPIYVPKLERPILHFSGGNGGDYARKGDHGDQNIFKM